MNRHRMGLLLIAALALVGPAGQCQTMFTQVRIVNKSALPPERLADALAAKALLTNYDPKLLRSAAELAPRDPRYWYLSAITRYVYVMGTRGYVPFEKIEPVYRALLKRALTADPNFLPALYAYVVSKPIHDQRMLALNRLTALDPDNAKPYYVMAIELYQQTIKGRTIIRSSDLQPYPMSRQEWQTVIDLIREGNQQPSFHANPCMLPSARNLRAYVHGRRASQAEMESQISETVESPCLGDDVGFTPLSLLSGSYARQIARQADWEAGKLAKTGNSAEALSDIAVVEKFGEKYAASVPHRLMSFAEGCSIRLIALAEHQRMSEAAGDATSVESVRKEIVRWKTASNAALRLTGIAFDRFIKSLRQHADYQPDYAGEEAQVGKLLAGLGLGEPKPPK